MEIIRVTEQNKELAINSAKVFYCGEEQREINDNFFLDDKTAIYISHRLSSCRFYDDIAVFHEGRLIQRGSHDILIADSSGKYYELWHTQVQYYEDKGRLEGCIE